MAKKMEQERLIYSDVYSLVCGDFFGSGLVVANVEALWGLSSLFFSFFFLPRVAEVREREDAWPWSWGRRSASRGPGGHHDHENPIRFISPDEGRLVNARRLQTAMERRCVTPPRVRREVEPVRGEPPEMGTLKIRASSFASNRSERLEFLERSHAVSCYESRSRGRITQARSLIAAPSTDRSTRDEPY